MTDDAHLHWETLGSRMLYDARIFKLNTVESRSVDSDSKASFVTLDSANWVTIIPALEGGESRFLIVRQYRHGSGLISLEFPAGMIDKGESPADAAARELLEETGYRAELLEEIGSVNPNPAFMTNTTYTFRARGLQKVAELKLDEHEMIDVHEYGYSELLEAMGKAPFANAIMVQSWYWYLRASGRV